MKYVLYIFGLLWLLAISLTANSQSITLLSNNYLSYCAGSIIEIPVNLSGTWDGSNTFRLKLTTTYHESRRADTTFYVQAINNQSPLRFQLPALYNNDDWSSQSQAFTITVQSSNPIINSNSKYTTINKLPFIKLLYAMDGTVGIQYNEYKNADVSKMIKTILATGSDDNTCRFKLNDSTTLSSGIFTVNPVSTTTYNVVRVWNGCGVGKVLGNNSITVKANPFRIKNASVIPKEICENKKIRIKFDYEGRFNSTNRFYIDLCNRTGDTVRALTTFTEDSSNVFADIPSNIPSGTYAVRVRGTSPDIATGYSEIIIQPKPIIDIGGYYNQQSYPYNYPLQIRADFYGGSIKPLLIRFTDGTTGKNWGSYTGGVAGSGYITDLVLNLNPNKYYTIDSLSTTCGVLKDYTVLGAKTFNIIEDFYIEPLPKNVYCEGEKIKFKIKSDYLFTSNNSFTLNIYSSNILVISVPALVVGDSLEATLPTGNQLSSFGYEGFNLSLSSSLPQKTSTRTWDYFSIKRKPDFTLSSTNTTLTNPGIVSIDGLVSGNKSFTTTINNGIRDIEYSCLPQYYDNDTYISQRYSAIRVFAEKSQTFSIKNISNSCGTKTFTTPLAYAVAVSNPVAKYIYFTNIEKLQTISRDRSFVVKFDTSGPFLSNDVFTVNLTYNGVSYEIGRGSQSPITIVIPSDFPSFTNNNISGILEIKSVLQSSIQSQQLTTNIYNNLTGTFDGSSVYFGLSIPTLKTPKKVTYALKDDLLTTYLSTNLINTYEYKINGKWFHKSSTDYENFFLIKIKVNKDTSLILEAIRDFQNEFIVRDTIYIKVKKFRISAFANGQPVCQGDQLEIYFNVEGNTIYTAPNDFKIFLKYPNSPNQNVDTITRELPIITKKQGSYIVKIPEFPYVGSRYFIKIIPTNGSEGDFATYTTQPNLWIDRKMQVGLTAMDGSNTAWFDGSITGVNLKATPIDVKFQESYWSYWSGRIEQISGNQQTGVSSTYPIQGVNAIPSQFKITNIQTQCGYGVGVGIVELKRCLRDVNTFTYNFFQEDKEIYSSTYLNIFGITPYAISPNVIPPNVKCLYSAKSFVEIFSGFEISGNSVKNFDVEVKGCAVTPR
jgi:hypothetical protein